MKGQAGFTVIEGLVTGILAAGMAGIVLGIVYMNTDRIREDSADLKLQRIYEVVAYRIGWSARMAAAVMAEGESFSGRNSLAARDSAQSIMTYNRNGAVTAGYRISSGNLEEYNLISENFEPFQVAGETVTMAPGSYFSLLAARRGLLLDLRPRTIVSGDTFTVSPRGDRFQCRNADL